MSIRNSIRHWIRDIRAYPRMRPADSSYDEYWSVRDMDAPMNAFQLDRAKIISALLTDGDRVVDIGCGDGRILEYLQRQNSTLIVRGLDSSLMALESARRRGLRVDQCDIAHMKESEVPESDWALLLEVLEHMPHCEEILATVLARCKNGVLFSVPNTGFFVHRIRLLLGRFPLQWRAHPGEHVRFWTLRDMRFWLDSQGYRADIIPYQGVPVLRKIWPAVFAAGLCVRVFPRTLT